MPGLLEFFDVKKEHQTDADGLNKFFQERRARLEKVLRDRELNHEGHVGFQVCNDPTLYEALLVSKWTLGLSLVQRDPEMAKYQEYRHGKFPGWYPLHLACYIGSSPLELIEELLDAFPEAVNFCTSPRIGDTPLHMQARNSQATSSKMNVLIRHAEVRMQNRMGNTVLHVACGNNAVIDVLQALIAKDDSLLDIRNHANETPLISLWKSFLQSIPGAFSVCNIIRGQTVPISLYFARFWAKAQLLASRGDTEEARERLLAHDLVTSEAPVMMLHVALMLDPSLLTVVDDEGNFLLHKMIHRDYPFDQSIFDLVAFDQALETRTKQGETVLTVAIKKKMNVYIKAILQAAPSLVTQPDAVTQLYPWELAACKDCSVETLYLLLIERPVVRHYNI